MESTTTMGPHFGSAQSAGDGVSFWGWCHVLGWDSPHRLGSRSVTSCHVMEHIVAGSDIIFGVCFLPDNLDSGLV